MSEVLRIDVDDAQVRAIMALMDEALRKKELLITILTQAGGLDAIFQRIADVEAGLGDVDDKAEGLDLPTIDRGTRMILLRIPGLREAMRLLYMIKMMQRTLGLGEIRGPVTAGILAVMYAYMALEAINKRQDRLESRINDLERTFTQRYVTMEEAVRGHGELPQRYRSTVAP